MRIHHKLLLLFLSVSMFACGEPSFLGHVGQPTLDFADFELSVGDTSPTITYPSNTTAATITSGVKFEPTWYVDYGSPATVTITLLAPPLGDPAVTLMSSTCSAIADSSYPCTLSDKISCIYDAASVNITCTLGTSNSVIDLTSMAAVLAGDLYLKFTACAADDATNCAPTSSIKVKLVP